MAGERQPGPPAKKKVRTYKADLGTLVSLEAGKSFEGTFQGAKEITIRDQQTGDPKQVMRYQFRADNGKKCVMLGAYLLDEQFQEVFNNEGGLEKCIGLKMRIERGEDEKLPGKRTMGTYGISVWEE